MTELGIVIFSKPEPKNALAFIVSTVDGMTNSDKDVNPSNAPIIISLSWLSPLKVTEERLEQ